jgi:hypothetical protein
MVALQRRRAGEVHAEVSQDSGSSLAIVFDFLSE